MADDGDVPEFANDEAAARYWRCLANDLRDELEEIRASSKDLEHELDVDFEATEKREAELKGNNERLKADLDDAKTRYQSTLREHANTLALMQRELEQTRAEEAKLRTRVRDMEVDNDDLEKSERAMESTLQDLENRYSRSIERTALLEDELVAKARLEEEVQRLKDELRDANEELGVLRVQRASLPPPPMRPDTPPGSASELPTLAAGALENGDNPFRSAHSSLESETTPRKLADVKPSGMVRSSTSANLAISRIPSPVSPQRRVSMQGTPGSPTPLSQTVTSSIFAPVASTSGPKSAAKRQGAAVSEFNAAKDRILKARTERRTALPVSSNVTRVRRTSMAPSATPPFGSSTTRFNATRSAARHSLASSHVTPTPPPLPRYGADSPDSSPTIAVKGAVGGIPRRPPSRLSAVSTSSSSRPATPSGIPLRSPTPSDRMYASQMRPPSALGHRPASALGQTMRRKSVVPASAPVQRTAFGSTAPSRPAVAGHGRPPALAQSGMRRYSLKGSVVQSSTPPPPVPSLR